MSMEKINNIAVSWTEGYYGDEDLQDDNVWKNAFAAMKEICELSQDGGWTPCSVALPEKDGAYEVTFLLDDGRRRTTTAIFVAATKTWTDDILKIVAWKERTEPYRGEA